jgi:hypothetical protein
MIGLRAALCLLTWVVGSALALAQDIEPRRWAHLPVDTRLHGAAWLYTRGDIGLDPQLRIEDAEVDSHSVVLSHVRYFAVQDKTARLDVMLPVQSGQWEGLLDGAPRLANPAGLGDPHVRLSLNWAGAPALRGQEFVRYRAQHPINTTAGIGLDLQLPLGEYKRDKLINLGQNRFVIHPQAGVVHTRGPWSVELTAAAFFYTDNDEYYGSSKLEQDPLYAAQAHVVRTFASRNWVAAGAAYGWGGMSTINGVAKDDDRRNLLLGGSFGFPLGAAQAVRVAYIRGRPLEDLGVDSHNLLVVWTLRY